MPFVKGYKWTEEQRSKLVKALTGKKYPNRTMSQEGRKRVGVAQKIRFATQQHPNLGRHWKINPDKLALLKQQGRIRGGHNKPHSEKSKQLCRLGSLRGRLVQARSKGPTKIEAIVYGFLDQLGISFLKQQPMDGYILDAFIPSRALAVECDGDYWHSLPRTKAQDARKDALLQSRSIKVLRLKESQILDGSYKEPLCEALIEI